MQPTLSTLPLCFLILVLVYLTRGKLIPAMTFMSVFQASSILNVGSSFGVQASYALLIPALAQAFLLKRGRPNPRDRRATNADIVAFFFTLYCTAIALVGPRLFAGVPFTNPMMGFQVPLAWETSHLHQLFYLFLCFGLFLAVSHRSSLKEMQQSLDFYLAGNALAALIAVYQYVCLKSGLPFIEKLLYTNPTYGIFSAYEIGGFARINATFVEASAAASFFMPALAILAWRLLHQPTRKDAIYAALIFTGLFLTISTTGYVSMAFLIGLSLLVYLLKWPASSKARASKLVVGAAICLIGFAIAAIPTAQSAFANLLDIVIFSKTQTISYVQRGEMNTNALKTAADTYWLGAGYGVCRASSLLPTMLGNVGIPGVGLLFALVWQAFMPAWRMRRPSLYLYGQLLFGIAVSFFALLVAGPELTTPQLWLMLGAATARKLRRIGQTPPSLITPELANAPSVLTYAEPSARLSPITVD